MITKIQVTQEDIDNGVPKNCYKCPIACAIQRKVIKSYVDVACGNIQLYDEFLGNFLCRIVLPEIGKNFVKSFDSHMGFLPTDISPFEFDIDIPDIYLK